MCAAAIHAKRVNAATSAEISKCIETLVKASHYKFYHSSLSYTFLLELLHSLDSIQFERLLWPQMRKELKRPWEKQNINTICFLIQASVKYPNIVDAHFFASSLLTTEILTPSSFKHLLRLFWMNNSAVTASTHQSFDAFAKFLSKNATEKMLQQFWHDEIRMALLVPTTLKEMATLRILTIILNDLHVEADTVKHLLCDSFIGMITKNLRNTKLAELQDEPYHQFFQAIEKYLFEKSSITEDDKIAIILRFIDYPGTLMIERYAPNRFIHRVISTLKAGGIKSIFEFYKSILLDQRKKEPKSVEKWTRPEKEHCIQMLQYLLAQKSTLNDHDWRADQLKFLFHNALFKTNENTGDVDVLPADLAEKLKQTFFGSLLVRSPKLEVEKTILLKVVSYCNERLSSDDCNITMRHSLSDEALEAWNKMYKLVSNQAKRNKILYCVFDILLMHMGLQLFVDTPMAILAIGDLEKCMERSQKKLKSRASTGPIGEAEWIEVVVDLFLQLLSQNKNLLRNIVDNTFPNMCPHLTASAIDQILSMLDMNDLNPLTPSAEATGDSSDENESDDDDDEETSDIECEAGGSSEDESLSEDDEGTVTDQLRSFVSQALGDIGQETDGDSVDLNEMNEEEALRLDTALSDAFKNIIKSPIGGKHPSKRERTVNTTVMHFRIRVLDLLEIYLKTNPSLDNTINILTDLIPMYEHCAANKNLSHLTNRLNRVVRTLLNLRTFSNTEEATEAKLFEILHQVINMKANPAIIQEQNKLKMNVMAFLIIVSQLLKSTDPILFEGIAACLTHFLESRNPKLQQQCFNHILQMRWVGAWQLGKIIANTSLFEANKCRSFKRIQALELLTEIYKNNAFIDQRFDDIKMFKEKIETIIADYIEWLLESNQVSSKEFNSLLQLLTKIHKISRKTTKQSNVQWDKVFDNIKHIRQNLPLDNIKAYTVFCKNLGINDTLMSQNSTKNNQFKTIRKQNAPNDENETNKAPQDNGVPKKRKHSQTAESKQLKKSRKENRLKMSSVGLNGVSFSFNIGNDQDMDSE